MIAFGRDFSRRPSGKLAAEVILMAADQVPAHNRPAQPMTIEELAAALNVKPMQSTDEWAAEIFDTDEELEAFLTDMRASRDRSIA